MGRKRKTKQRHLFEIKPKSQGQQNYLDSIRKNTVTICDGLAGTGKTMCSVGAALQLVQDENTEYKRIVIVRPAIEACGESIGFLPGGIADKMRPLIQPVIDNLRYFIDDEGYIETMLNGGMNSGPIIEVIPMAYIRGRTLLNCVVIFDEAQNASPQQMKLFLTRIGRHCKVIIEGDGTQSDKYKIMKYNGLNDAISRLGDCPDVGIVLLGENDIHRSKIIAPILERYKDVQGL